MPRLTGAVLLVGAGGVGAPAAWALAAAGVSRLVIVDDDRVEASNLHRQILFRDEDVGAKKAETLARRVAELGVDASFVDGRALPDTALALVSSVDVVIDGVDNFASRFLLADAAFLAKKSIVHAAAVRWTATMFVTGCDARPCYRCLFEDVPDGVAPDCATAGIVGPVCGVVGGMAADAAIGLLSGRADLAGSITRFDGKTGAIRRTMVAPRSDCPLCGTRAITSLDEARYLSPACDT